MRNPHRPKAVSDCKHESKYSHLFLGSVLEGGRGQSLRPQHVAAGVLKQEIDFITFDASKGVKVKTTLCLQYPETRSLMQFPICEVVRFVKFSRFGQKDFTNRGERKRKLTQIIVVPGQVSFGHSCRFSIHTRVTWARMVTCAEMFSPFLIHYPPLFLWTRLMRCLNLRVVTFFAWSSLVCKSAVQHPRNCQTWDNSSA